MNNKIDYLNPNDKNKSLSIAGIYAIDPAYINYLNKYERKVCQEHNELTSKPRPYMALVVNKYTK